MEEQDAYNILDLAVTMQQTKASRGGVGRHRILRLET